MVLLLLAAVPLAGRDSTDIATDPVTGFLAQQRALPPHHAVRRLTAEGRSQIGWMQVATSYSASRGFTYEVTAQGGSDLVRSRVLTPMLQRERQLIASRQADRSSLLPANYTFTSSGFDASGLASVRLAPKRKEPELVAGTLYLRPDGEPVRLEGTLAKTPSFWLKRVDIVRTYERIGGFVMPVLLESDAELRLFGRARLTMTYSYSEIDGRPVDDVREARR